MTMTSKTNQMFYAQHSYQTWRPLLSSRLRLAIDCPSYTLHCYRFKSILQTTLTHFRIPLRYYYGPFLLCVYFLCELHLIDDNPGTPTQFLLALAL